jgi:hypothetical protein
MHFTFRSSPGAKSLGTREISNLGLTAIKGLLVRLRNALSVYGQPSVQAFYTISPAHRDLARRGGLSTFDLRLFSIL